MTARDRLIASAIDLVRRNGVAGTGLAELLKHSGAARRSVYVNFPGGKSELVAEATRVAGQGMNAILAEDPAGGTVRRALAAFIESWKETLRSSGYDAGCPVVAAALGRNESPSAANAAGEVFAGWQAMITHRLTVEGADTADAEAIATTTVAAVEGAVILCLASQSTDPLDKTARMLDTLIAEHTSDEPSMDC